MSTTIPLPPPPKGKVAESVKINVLRTEKEESIVRDPVYVIDFSESGGHGIDDVS